MSIKQFETAVIREWKGKWKGTTELENIPAGGYVLTFHKGTSPAHRAEHYNTVEEILEKYEYRYTWMTPDPEDENDIVLVGI